MQWRATKAQPLGVALLAAVGAGEFKSVPEACKATIRTVDQHKPNRRAGRQYAQSMNVYSKLYPALRERFVEIGASSE